MVLGMAMTMVMMVMASLNVFNLRGIGEVVTDVHANTRKLDDIYERHNGQFNVTDVAWRKATSAEILNPLNTKHDQETNHKNRYVLPASEDGVLHLRGVGTHPQEFTVNNRDGKLCAPSLKQVCQAMEPDTVGEDTDEHDDGDDSAAPGAQVVPVIIDDAPGAPAAPVVAVVGDAASGASGVADVEFTAANPDPNTYKPRYTMGPAVTARALSPGKHTSLPPCIQKFVKCDAGQCTGGQDKKFCKILKSVKLSSVKLAFGCCIKPDCGCGHGMHRANIIEVRDEFVTLQWTDANKHNHNKIEVNSLFVLTAKK